MTTPEIDEAREELRQLLREALPFTPGKADRIVEAIDAYSSAQIALAVEMAATDRALECHTEAPTEPQRNALPPPPTPGQDAWVIVSRHGTLVKVCEHEHEARREASQWYDNGPAAVAKYVPAERLERAQEDLRKVSEFYSAPTRCACGEEGCTVDMTPGAETMRCAACGADRYGDTVQRAAYDALVLVLDRMRAALREIASGNGSSWATSVASIALRGAIEAPSTTCKVEVVPAPGDRCGNTGKLPGGRACPGCRSCA